MNFMVRLNPLPSSVSALKTFNHINPVSIGCSMDSLTRNVKSLKKYEDNLTKPNFLSLKGKMIFFIYPQNK